MNADFISTREDPIMRLMTDTETFIMMYHEKEIQFSGALISSSHDDEISEWDLQPRFIHCPDLQGRD
jgi:hypothetical protein